MLTCSHFTAQEVAKQGPGRKYYSVEAALNHTIAAVDHSVFSTNHLVISVRSWYSASPCMPDS